MDEQAVRRLRTHWQEAVDRRDLIQIPGMRDRIADRLVCRCQFPAALGKKRGFALFKADTAFFAQITKF